MAWDAEYTDEFGKWWGTLTENQQDSITATVELLIEYGPQLKFPHSSSIEGSKYSHMRELRVQSGGNPIRIFYAFDPRRIAILLTGSGKKGKDRFYEEYIPVADKLYTQHIEDLKKEGLIK